MDNQKLLLHPWFERSIGILSTLGCPKWNKFNLEQIKSTDTSSLNHPLVNLIHSDILNLMWHLQFNNLCLFNQSSNGSKTTQFIYICLPNISLFLMKVQKYTKFKLNKFNIWIKDIHVQSKRMKVFLLLILNFYTLLILYQIKF